MTKASTSSGICRDLVSQTTKTLRAPNHIGLASVVMGNLSIVMGDHQYFGWFIHGTFTKKWIIHEWWTGIDPMTNVGIFLQRSEKAINRSGKIAGFSNHLVWIFIIGFHHIPMINLWIKLLYSPPLPGIIQDSASMMCWSYDCLEPLQSVIHRWKLVCHVQALGGCRCVSRAKWQDSCDVHQNCMIKNNVYIYVYIYTNKLYIYNILYIHYITLHIYIYIYYLILY